MKTLFDKSQPSDGARLRNRVPYSELLANADETSFAPDETAIFRHVIEHEVHLYEPRGFLAGPLRLLTNGTGWLDCRSKKRGALRIPTWVEDDGLTIETGASAVLLVESQRAFRLLAACKRVNELNMILATGCGLPRYGVRRLLHRIATEMSIPVYVLTDNDTWGYFLYSMVLRGTLCPRRECPFLAVSNAVFLGMRVGDAAQIVDSNVVRRGWKAHWDARIKCLRSYACFRGVREWDREFRQFVLQRCAYDLVPLIEEVGPTRFAEDYLKKRLVQA